MKLPILLRALYLRPSPALAEDILYLKCDESWVITGLIEWGDGDKSTRRRGAKETYVLRIDTRNTKIIYNNNKKADDIVIQNNEMIFSDKHEDKIHESSVVDSFKNAGCHSLMPSAFNLL